MANIIASRVATKLNKILEKLEDNSVLQYSLLSALFQLMQFKEEESKLELSTEILEKYLTLMCQVEPEYVSYCQFMILNLFITKKIIITFFCQGR